jgi:hypothetical protein
VVACAFLPFAAWLLFVNTSHDGSHFAFSRASAAANEAVAATACPLFYNSGHWMHQHVVAHHVHTNEPGRDFDLHHQAPFTRLHGAERWLPAHARQAAFILATAPLACLVQCTVFPARLLAGASFMGQPADGDGGELHGAAAAAPLAKRTRAAAAAQLAVTLAVLAYPAVRWGATAAAAAWTLYPFAVSSLLFMAVTQVSHLQARAQRRPRAAGEHWAHRMVDTAVDYSQGSHLATFLTGGLNMQGLHHCAPTLSSARFVEAYPIYRALCAKHGLVIHEEPSFLHALASYWAHVCALSSDAPAHEE